jgi:hypothetical protein
MKSIRAFYVAIFVIIGISACGPQLPERGTPSAGSVEQALSAPFTWYPSQLPKFIPPHTAGDLDFVGHGPDIFVQASLYVKGTQEVWCRVIMDAAETTYDHTEAYGATDFFIYRHPSPIKILSDTSTNLSYVDSNHNDDFFYPASTEAVKIFRVTGDTDGLDAGIATGVIITLNPIILQVQVGCQGYCGTQSPDGCWCDPACKTYGDCCGDACFTCSGISCF